MKHLLTPKQLATAIGVSESSVRRWIDAGLLQTSRTPGGHRRIPLPDAVRFVRASHANAVRPELLGLAPLTTPPATPPNLAAESERLYQALLAGDAPLARDLTLSLYLTGSPLPSLFDGPLASSMHRLGDLYQHSPKGILLEHRATDIALQTLSLLRDLLPTTQSSDLSPQSSIPPLAIGGTPPDDIYLLPAQMAAATLADAGYRVHHLGPDVPFDTLAAAAEDSHPRLVYLSLTSATAIERLTAADLHTLATRLARYHSLLVVGGQQLPKLHLTPHPNLHPLPHMTALSTFAKEKIATDENQIKDR